MPRFIRSEQHPEPEQNVPATAEEHAEMIERVRAYAEPLTPDPASPLSPRDQLLKGVTRPGRGAPPRRRARY